MGTMAQLDRIGKTATNTRVEGNKTILRYHNTDVVTLDHAAQTVTLNSGGWRTITTKTRMNQAARQWDMGFFVYQTKGEWIVNTPDCDNREFFDGITFPIKRRTTD